MTWSSGLHTRDVTACGKWLRAELYLVTPTMSRGGFRRFFIRNLRYKTADIYINALRTGTRRLAGLQTWDVNG